MKTTLYIKALFLTLGLTTATTWGPRPPYRKGHRGEKDGSQEEEGHPSSFHGRDRLLRLPCRGGGRLSKVATPATSGFSSSDRSA